VSQIHRMLLISAVALAGSAVACLAAAAAQQAVLDHYAQEAQASGDPFSGFSADRGKAFFLASHGSGDTPSCSTCHTTDPTNVGRTRVGKAIKPMAVSANPDRFTDPAKVEKWFRRNCNTVLGRECTPAEKGDFIAFMMSL
jgi:mono/diheme cytochrome c family protein